MATLRARSLSPFSVIVDLSSHRTFELPSSGILIKSTRTVVKSSRRLSFDFSIPAGVFRVIFVPLGGLSLIIEFESEDSNLQVELKRRWRFQKNRTDSVID